MQCAYREMLGPHMVTMMLVTAAAIVGIYGALGPVGSHVAVPPHQRWGYGVLYACVSWPVCYCINVVALYCVRFRSPPEAAAAVTVAALFAAVPCSAFVHTVETLVRPDYSADAGLLWLYIMVATSAVACSLLFLYVVYQRVKHSKALAADVDSEHGHPRGSRRRA